MNEFPRVAASTSETVPVSLEGAGVASGDTVASGETVVSGVADTETAGDGVAIAVDAGVED